MDAMRRRNVAFIHRFVRRRQNRKPGPVLAGRHARAGSQEIRPDSRLRGHDKGFDR